MILYRKEPYRLQMRNIMLLDDVASGGVVYVNKSTYDQALLLHGRLDGDPKRVLDLLNSPKTQAWRATLGLNDLVENMMKTMPQPLNMIAPFLIYCTPNQGIQWDANDREFAYGILHTYSQLIDFNAMTLVPVEVRNNVSVPTTILKDYKVSWDDLCSSLEDKVVVVNQPVVTQSVPVSVTSPAPVSAPVPAQPVAPAPAPTPVATSTEDDMEAKIRAFQERMAKEAEQEQIEREKKAKEREAKKATGTPKPTAPAPVINKNEAQQVADVLDEYDV